MKFFCVPICLISPNNTYQSLIVLAKAMCVFNLLFLYLHFKNISLPSSNLTSIGSSKRLVCLERANLPWSHGFMPSLLLWCKNKENNKNNLLGVQSITDLWYFLWSLFVLLVQIHQWEFLHCGLEFLQETLIAPMFYLLLCTSFVIKTYDHGQDFHFYHKTKHKAAEVQHWSNATVFEWFVLFRLLVFGCRIKLFIFNTFCSSRIVVITSELSEVSLNCGIDVVEVSDFFTGRNSLFCSKW